MRVHQLKVGTRVRAKVPTIFGWKGTGTVVAGTTFDTVCVVKDGYDLEDRSGECLFCRHELAIMRDQTPPI